MSNSRGITLIELLVVIAIMGVLISLISVSTATPTDKSILESAVNMIAQDIRLTQQLAICRGETYFFEINVKENYYRIRSNLAGTYKMEYLNDGISISIIGLESPYTGSYSDLRVLRYTPAGTPSTTGTITLKKGGLTRQITIMVGTGRVSIN
ncbi:general secretion pathway protein H [Caldicoprobacter guelmensis]|uniref:prepilin-type N-terminal cleavage/methylation domain-containing protein n=1 Tax=Caldicoprobacter guelmensis TaxID=1170224 RepID=UPI00195D7302|nr:prepilin-type N-terminal cleavage/methylation domain-containing protein [Caldicoprobacter guelmensis]MBM7581268.1 general secretion pathway protein H [Caldicoprobacter guelmensis]